MNELPTSIRAIAEALEDWVLGQFPSIKACITTDASSNPDSPQSIQLALSKPIIPNRFMIVDVYLLKITVWSSPTTARELDEWSLYRIEHSDPNMLNELQELLQAAYNKERNKHTACDHLEAPSDPA